MPQFKPPYGSPDQHVTAPAHHLGYRYLVAYLVGGGSRADYIRRACEEAHAEGAPKDVICRPNGEWKTRGDMTNLIVARRLDTYAAALTRYEEDLKKEREQRRSTRNTTTQEHHDHHPVQQPQGQGLSPTP